MSVTTIAIPSLLLMGLLIPLTMLIAWRLKLGLNRDIIVSHTRMVLQLTVIGFFLQWLFQFEGILPGLLWFFVMSMVATLAVIRSSRLRLILFVGPVGLAIGLTALMHLIIFLLAVGPEIWHARGIVPIGGMLLGNTMGSMIIGLSEFFSGLQNRRELYEFRRGLGNSRLRAALPFIRSGLQRSLAPQLAAVATVGIVSLPGMMTGQILSGASPLTAVSYQIAIMLAIFSTRLLGTVLVMLAGLLCGTTPLGNLRSVFRPS